MVAGVGVGTAMALNGAAAHAFSHILYNPCSSCVPVLLSMQPVSARLIS